MHRLGGNTDLLFIKFIRIIRLLLLAKKAIPNTKYRPINKILILSCYLLILKSQTKELKKLVRKLLLKRLK